MLGVLSHEPRSLHVAYEETLRSRVEFRIDAGSARMGLYAHGMGRRVKTKGILPFA